MGRIIFLVLIFSVICGIAILIVKGIKSMGMDKNDSISEELERIQELKDRGIISEEEFQKMKEKLIKKLK